MSRDVAGAGGFEPPTTGFGDQRSGQTELRSCDELSVIVPALASSRGFVSYWNLMVPLEGLEPPTRDLGRRRSIL